MADQEQDVWRRQQRLTGETQGPISATDVKRRVGQAGGYLGGLQTGMTPEQRARLINSIQTRGAATRQRAEEDIRGAAAAGGFGGTSAVGQMIGQARQAGAAELGQQLTSAELGMAEQARGEEFRKGGMLSQYATALAGLEQGQQRIGGQREQFYQSLLAQQDARAQEQENWMSEFMRQTGLDEEDARRYWEDWNQQQQYTEEERRLFMEDREQAERDRRRLLAQYAPTYGPQPMVG